MKENVIYFVCNVAAISLMIVCPFVFVPYFTR